MFNFNIEENQFITGEKFPEICDSIACFYTKKQNISGKIIYGDTYCKDEILSFVKKNSNTFFKIVFHNSDWNCPDDIPSNCIVFSQNLHIENKRKNCFSLPIGLENSKWFTKINKRKKIFEAKQLTPTKLCYCNFNTGTNPSIRIPAKNALEKPYITMDMHHNGYNFDSYLYNILNHFFVFSPPGNGIDCHRTWETLYLKRVPIIYNVYKSDLFEDLPVLIINSPDELTEEFLNKSKNIILNKKYNFEKLKINYWKDKILQTNTHEN